MRLLGAVLGILVFMIQPVLALTPADLVGTWKLISSVRQVAGSDQVVNNLGAHPNGILILTPDFRFMIIETAEGRKPAKTTEEFAMLQKTEIAYSGMATFTNDPNNPNGLKMVNRVDISWNEEWVGTSQERFLSLDGNKLTIRTGQIKNPVTGELATATLVFEKSK